MQYTTHALVATANKTHVHCNERHVCRGIVEKTGQHTRHPEKVPRSIQVKSRGTCVENLQDGSHRDENTEEQRGHLDHWMKMKMVGTVDCPWCRVPRQHGHCDHEALLNTSGPTKVSAEYGRPHDAQQIKTIDSTLDAKGMSRLHNFSQRPMGFYFFSCKDPLVINIE